MPKTSSSSALTNAQRNEASNWGDTQARNGEQEIDKSQMETPSEDDESEVVSNLSEDWTKNIHVQKIPFP